MTVRCGARAVTAAVVAALVGGRPPLVSARTSGDPIRLVWDEADVAGMSTIWDRAGETPIGSMEYHQVRRGDVLTTVRVARFADGSSDEDRAEARVAGSLVALSGRSTIRDPDGETTVDLAIDVPGGRITGWVGRGASRAAIDERERLPPGTYWGPLVFLVLKNFDANAEGDRVVFRTVAPTPRPIVLDMVLTRVGGERIDRTGIAVQTARFALRPTIHWSIDPLVRLLAPDATFWVLPGDPPALARFAGPRNWARQPIVIE
ncbi:MAG TPA: hypothetical protein VFD84_00290 [Candidatus Binatia bacterium]|jgi:hypothetical protein|nr:hypothetical protein [Candidatus Binatia bacterium]